MTCRRLLPTPLVVLGGFTATGCGSVSSLDDRAFQSVGEWCEPRVLEPGEVRARRIGCSDEFVDEGSAQKGDWLLENDRLRLHVRDGHSALTQLERAGGTALDLSTDRGPDLLTELAPSPSAGALADATVSAWLGEDAARDDGLAADGRSARLVVEGHTADGTPARFEYRLDPDADHVSLVDVAAATLVPQPGTEWAGSRGWLGGDVVALDGGVTDLGGWIDLAGPTLLAGGDPERVAATLWPDGLDVDGTTEGEWVEALADGAGDSDVVARLPVTDGRFAGRLPAGTAAVRAVAGGHADGDPEEPGRGLELSVGEFGQLVVRVADDDGRDIPATVFWRHLSTEAEPEPTWARYPLSAGGGTAPVGPGEGEGWISAGPAYEAHAIRATEVVGDLDVSAILARAVTPAVLADLARPAAPDPTERRAASTITDEAASEGLGYAVLVATDEVASAEVDPHTAEWLVASAGSRAGAPSGTVVAWPWTPDAEQPAHSAVPWADIGPIDLLSAMSLQGARLVVADTDWAASAGDTIDWSPAPDALLLRSIDDLDAYVSLLDNWIALAAVGPLTWVENVGGDDASGGARPPGTSAVDVERAVVEQATVATNGPRIVLEVDGQGPGSLVEGRGLLSVTVRVEAPAWMPIAGVALIGTGGQRLAEWTPDQGGVRLEADVRVPRGDWLLATCWGDEAVPPLLEEPAWAVTSPVWTRRP